MPRRLLKILALLTVTASLGGCVAYTGGYRQGAYGYGGPSRYAYGGGYDRGYYGGYNRGYNRGYYGGGYGGGYYRGWR
jgi:hypothetical protein